MKKWGEELFTDSDEELKKKIAVYFAFTKAQGEGLEVAVVGADVKTVLIYLIEQNYRSSCISLYQNELILRRLDRIIEALRHAK